MICSLPINNAFIRALSERSELRETSNGWECRCPAHDDRNASLSVGRGDDGKILITCHAGCEREAIVASVGLTMAALMPPKTNGNGKSHVVATYDYHDENGVLLSQVCRMEPKDFRQRAPDGKGGWKWSMTGVRRVLYNLPAVLAASTVLVVEGEKDADRLNALGFVATTNVGGANKWRKEYSESLRGRHVVILVDNDPAGRAHGRRVANSLGGIAASIKIIELPGLPEKGDVSDWLNAGGTAESLAKIVAATPCHAAAESKPAEPENPGTIKLVADQITSHTRFAQDGGGKLYRHHDGVYKPTAETFIKQEVKRQLHVLELTAQWSSRKASDICEYIRVDAEQLWDRPPVNVLNVRNGLLNITTRELRPHRPDHLSPIQLPVTFDPAATCPKWDAFVEDVFPADARNLAWEIFGWLMVADVSIQKAVLLTGEGANGKSRFLAGLQAFLGKSNTCGLSLHRLESDRFCTARLMGKLANICPDLPSDHLASTSTFKSITGGDSLVAEYKFRDSFEFQPFARLVFSANHPPQSQDGSHGFFRRWLVVPFSKIFTNDPERIDPARLDAMLSEPAELSGVLNRAIDARAHLERQKGFSEPQSVIEAATEFEAVTNPFSVWLETNTVSGSDKWILKSQLQAAYNQDAIKHGRPLMNHTKFGRELKRLRPNLEQSQRGGRKEWSYDGIGLSSTINPD